MRKRTKMSDETKDKIRQAAKKNRNKILQKKELSYETLDSKR